MEELARPRSKFSTQPYTQLSAVLATAGRRDTADAIDYARRQRERAEAWKHADFGYWAWLSFLWGVSGYGIGQLVWRVLWWLAVSPSSA